MWRSYWHTVLWDISKTYSTVHTEEEEMHMRRIVWQKGVREDKFKVYRFLRMHFSDRPVMCGLEVAKWQVANSEEHNDPEDAWMIKQI